MASDQNAKEHKIQSHFICIRWICRQTWKEMRERTKTKMLRRLNKVQREREGRIARDMAGPAGKVTLKKPYIWSRGKQLVLFSRES